MKDLKNILLWIFGFIKPINFTLGLLLGLFIINKFGLNVFQHWKLEYNSVAVDYLKVLLDLPAVILCIFLFFFIKFYSAIDYLIRNLRIKYKDIEATSQQAKNIFPEEAQTKDKNNDNINLSKQDAQKIAAGIENLQNENKSKQKQIEELQGIVTQLANRSEFFEFRYLDTILVFNTKIVLRDLYKIGQMVNNIFIASIFVPATTIDKNSEKLAIYNALFVNGLIVDNGTFITVSEKGGRYLRFTTLI